MTIRAVEGVAGSGKTYRLMELLSARLAGTQLEPGQRVLAVTFMHGSRHRLRERLRAMRSLGHAFECLTIDSFAARVMRRWRTLAKCIGMTVPSETDFEGQCEAAGTLMQQAEVLDWIVASYPIVIIDEAQDVTSARLSMIRSLAETDLTLIAADEFQCLDSELRPNPCVGWLRSVTEPEVLGETVRTRVPDLLAAAAAIRAGAGPVGGPHLKFVSVRGSPIASACLANAIAWGVPGTVAVITPSVQGGFAYDVVKRVTAGPCGRHKNGPYAFRWEHREDEAVSTILRQFELREVNIYEQLAEVLSAHRDGVLAQVGEWVRLQRRALGKTLFTKAELEARVRRYLSLQRQSQRESKRRFRAMTVHQAKNREFDGVVVIWPYTVAGDAEQKRRLLYNALTRARNWCTVIAQNAHLLAQPPFV